MHYRDNARFHCYLSQVYSFCFIFSCRQVQVQLILIRLTDRLWCPKFWNINHKKSYGFYLRFFLVWSLDPIWCLISPLKCKKNCFHFSMGWKLIFNSKLILIYHQMNRWWVFFRARMKRVIQNQYPGLMDFLHDEFHDHEDDKWLALFREQDKAHKHEQTQEK